MVRKPQNSSTRVVVIGGCHVGIERVMVLM